MCSLSLSKPYKWSEDEESITISIPFRGKSLKKTELVIFDTLIKIYSFPSYRLEIYLQHSINDLLSKAIIQNDSLIIHLHKEIPGFWRVLEFEGTKEECKERRRLSLVKWEEKIQLRHKHAMIQRREEQRSTVKSQVRIMYIDTIAY